MAINKNDMAAAIKAKFDSITNGINWGNGELPGNGVYNKAFDEGLSEYIASNLEITYSWSATMPPPVSSPDPIASFAAKVSYPTFSIGTPSSFAAWGAMIQKEVLAGIIKPKETAFVLGPLSFLVVPLVLVQGDDLEGICGQICTWLKKCINPVPVSGVHGAFTVPAPGAIMTLIA